MDKCTTEVRRQYWKGIIAQCQARPQGQSAKAWLEENQICEQTYYLWQRRIRQEMFEEMKYYFRFYFKTRAGSWCVFYIVFYFPVSMICFCISESRFFCIAVLL